MNPTGRFVVSDQIREFIDDLISQMTLEEMAGQLNMPADAGGTSDEDIRSGKVGVAICAHSAYAGNERQESVRAQDLNRLQKLAVEESRLGIPLLMGRDVIHGHRTVFPIPLAQSCCWDEELVEEMARVSALEAAASGIRWVFTPMLDIARDARWGRVAEGFGEDPYLASRLAEAAVRGYQGEDTTDLNRVLTCIKHFAGYGAVEGGRDYNTCEITPHTLRNVYLPPFKAAVDAGAVTLMAAFTEIGGVPTPANTRLLTEILKEEWGFAGPVVSDWGAVKELIEHGVAEDEAHSAEIAINAGIDVDMATTCFVDHLPDLVRAERVSEERLKDAVRRVLAAKKAMGLFENPYIEIGKDETLHRLPESVALARRAAAKCCVLLKNEGQLLPITKSPESIAVVGPMADAKGLLFGTWTLDGEPSDVVSVAEALKAAGLPTWRAEMNDDAVSVARYCDLAIAVLGESPGRSGEDNTVTNIGLPGGQVELVKSLKAMGVPLVVVVISGRPLDLTEISSHADALIWTGHPGVEGGNGIVDVLTGKADAGGRLTTTFPRSTGQVPIYYNRKATGRPLDPYARGRSRLIDCPDSPLFEFGSGFSYADFSLGDLKIEEMGDKVRASAVLTNESEVSGTEVEQLYIRDRVASMTRPVKELKGFRRVFLQPGESKEVAFELGEEDLGFYGQDEKFVCEPGKFDLWIGLDSVNGLDGEFEILP